MLAVGALAAGLAFAGPALADGGSITGIQVHGMPPIKVESGGGKYTKLVGSPGAIQGTLHLEVNAGVFGKVKSWEAWPILGMEQEGAWNDFPKSGHSQSYGLPRPKTVNTGFPFSIPRADYDTFMVRTCNYHADRLRGQGLSNAEIFGEDREYKLPVWGGLEYENSGLVGAVDPSEVHSFDDYGKVTLICQGDHQELDPVKPDVTSASLVVKPSKSVQGSCALHLGGSIISKEPNVEVKFRYVDDDGKQSDVKTVTTNAGRIATFEHSYPIAAGGHKSGKVQIVGASHAFLSKWVDYAVDCAVASQDKVSLLPPKATHLEGIATADETMHQGFACPEKVKIYGVLKGRGEVSGAASLFAAGQLKVLKQYSIENGQTIVVEGEHDLDWSSVHAFGGTVPHQSVKFAMNVTNAAAALVDHIEATQLFSCRTVGTSSVAQGAAGGLSNAAPKPLPAQQAGGQQAGGQQALAQSPAIAIMAPRGLVRSGRIRLSGAAADATYTLKFYRKAGAGWQAVKAAQLPAQMTGATASFNLKALTGGRDWRLEVCPAGARGQGACKSSDFRLPVIASKTGGKAAQPPKTTAVFIVPSAAN